MALGELYKPSGLARETAQAVLEVDEPYAVNVALGCSNGCPMCYGPLATRQSREKWMNVRQPKKKPAELVDFQLSFGKLHERLEGVFLSFLTDVFLKENEENTELLIELLYFDWEIHRIATLSKLGTSLFSGVRHGITIVSLDEKFWRKYEPNALHPRKRIKLWEDRGYTWASVEPYPTSAIWKQSLEPLLEELKFVNLIVFGKWNYDKRANTEQARQEYADNIHTAEDFCKSNSIRLHVKSNTLKFAFGERVIRGEWQGKERTVN